MHTINKNYILKHKRLGDFVVSLDDFDDLRFYVTIVSGVGNHMHNSKYVKFEKSSFRRCFCNLKEIKNEKV